MSKCTLRIIVLIMFGISVGNSAETTSIWSEDSLKGVVQKDRSIGEIMASTSGKTQHEGYSVHHFVFTVSSEETLRNLRDSIAEHLKEFMEDNGMFIWASRTPNPPPSLTLVFAMEDAAGNVSMTLAKGNDLETIDIVFFVTEVDYSRPLITPGDF